MGRAKREIDRDTLESALRKAESRETFRTQKDLFDKVASEPWAKEAGATASVIYLRVKEHGIELKTEPARKVTPKNSQEKPSRHRDEDLRPESATKQKFREGFRKAIGEPDPDPIFKAPEEKPEPQSARSLSINIDKLGDLVRIFKDADIEVATVSDMMTSEYNTDDQNRSIRDCWDDFRHEFDVPDDENSYKRDVAAKIENKLFSEFTGRELHTVARAWNCIAEILGYDISRRMELNIIR